MSIEDAPTGRDAVMNPAIVGGEIQGASENWMSSDLGQALSRGADERVEASRQTAVP
jgi:hypothetical protein